MYTLSNALKISMSLPDIYYALDELAGINLHLIFDWKGVSTVSGNGYRSLGPIMPLSDHFDIECPTPNPLKVW